MRHKSAIYILTGEDMSVRDGAPAVKEAWARASSLSMDGLLHDAVMEFLRVRYVLSTTACATDAAE